MNPMRRGRALALDYGQRNVGLACSDDLGVTIRPLPSIPNRGRRDLLLRLSSAIADNAIDEVVVGIPWNMDGSAGDSVRRVQRFMEMLRARLDLPLHGIDERLSTIEAHEVWRTLRPKQQKKYRTVDSLAAAFILERFLKES